MSENNELFKYLPDIYKSQDVFDIGKTNNTFDKFLSAFEKVLLGRKDDVNIIDEKTVIGLEEQIAQVYDYFDPLKATDDFLSWLAGWTALSLRADLPQEKEQTFIANIISHYNKRGTKGNLEALLKIFLDAEVIITEPSFIVGKVKVGNNSYIGENPHFFVVEMAFPDFLKLNTVTQEAITDTSEHKQRVQKFKQKTAIARFVIELEKPAHTHYQLKIKYPGTFKVGTSRLGKNSFLGTRA